MDLSSLIGKIPILPDDHLLELRDTQPGTDKDFIAIGLRGFYYFDGEIWQAFRYSEIKYIEKPPKDGPAQELVLHLDTGHIITLPIKGGPGIFREVYQRLLLERAIPI